MEIARGAEATITATGSKVQKDRHAKSYRLPELDEHLRKTRAKAEARIMEKLADLPVPRLIDSSGYQIIMERINGQRMTTDDVHRHADQVGAIIAGVHSRGIIHGDLTASNMLLSEGKVYIIDFGLSYHSRKTEDRAVDLHVLRETLKGEDTKAFEAVILHYRPTFREDVITRLSEVEACGRNKPSA